MSELESRADPPTDCTAGTLSSEIARYTYGYDDFKAVRASWASAPPAHHPDRADSAELLVDRALSPLQLSSTARSSPAQVMILIWRNLALTGSLWCGSCPASARGH